MKYVLCARSNFKHVLYIYIYKFNAHNYTREKVVLTHFMNEETKAV